MQNNSCDCIAEILLMHIHNRLSEISAYFNNKKTPDYITCFQKMENLFLSSRR